MDESKSSQCQRIIDYIVKHGSISSSQAMDDLGCFRLASRIHDLKRKGFPIIDSWAEGKNRFGDTTRYKVYGLEEGCTLSNLN